MKPFNTNHQYDYADGDIIDCFGSSMDAGRPAELCDELNMLMSIVKDKTVRNEELEDENTRLRKTILTYLNRDTDLSDSDVGMNNALRENGVRLEVKRTFMTPGCNFPTAILTNT